MPRLLVLALVAVLVPPPGGGAAPADDNPAGALGSTARDSTDFPEARVAALDALAQLGPKAAPALQALEQLLDSLKSDDDDARTDLFVVHTARALGAMGPAARDALPHLVGAASKVHDPVARRALTAAIFAIGTGPAAPAPATLKTCAQLQKELEDRRYPDQQLLAAVEIGNRSDCRDATAFRALVKAMQYDNVSVSSAAREAARKVYCALPKNALAWGDVCDYIMGLKALLADKSPTQRIQAATDLAALGDTARDLVADLYLVANTDGNADVRRAALTAADLITRSAGSKK